MISELAAKAFASRDIAHREHWKTTSYAAHVALGAFYDDVIESIDAIIENYQGMYGKIDHFEVETEKVTDIAEYLTECADWIESNRSELCQGSESIGSQIDILTSVYTRTVFLLGMK